MSSAHLHYEALPPRIWRDGDDLHIMDTGGSEVVLTASYETLAKWFRDEADERLGRTRIAAHPDYVAYDHGEYHAIVIDEKRGIADIVSVRTILAAPADAKDSPALVVARANLEPRVAAWYFAEPGELWDVEWGREGRDGETTTTIRALVVARPGLREHPMFALVNGETVSVEAVGVKSATRVETYESQEN